MRVTTRKTFEWWDTHLDRDGRQKMADGFKARCPAHADEGPSLHVTRKGAAGAVVHCFAGCEYEAIVSAAREGGRSVEPGESGDEAESVASEAADGISAPLAWLAEYTGVDRSVIEALPIEAQAGKVAFCFPGGVAKTRVPGPEKAFGWTGPRGMRPSIFPLEDHYPDTIILTEGETDMICLRATGATNAYAITKGAAGALSGDEIAALGARGVERIILAFDSDEAGREASEQQSGQIVAAGLSVATIAPAVDALLGEKDWRAWYLAGGRTLPDPDARDLFTTYTDLRDSPYRDVQWIAEGMVARNALTLIAGPPKSGKSTTILELLAACERGRPFLGLSVPRIDALVMTEEYDATLWEKVEDDLHRAVFLKQATVPEMPFAQALSLAVSKCLTDKRKILVIDTLSAWVGFEDENDASKVTPALNLIRAQIANTGIACILVHHSKKGGGDHGEAIRGSSALLASVDISIEFAYAGHDRRISILSRFGGDYPDVIVAREGGSLVLRGTAEQVRDEEDEKRIALLPEAPGMTRAEIEKLWGASQRVTEKYLGRYQAWQRVGKNMPPSGRGTTYFRLPMPHLKDSGDD